MNRLVDEPVDLSSFPLGINNVEKETSLPDGALRNSVNFDISNDGKMKLRPGYTQVYSGTGIHSLSPEDVTAGVFFVENGTLKELDEGYNATPLATVSSDPRRRMSYIQMADNVYYSNGFDSGMIHQSTSYRWGVPTPERAPVLSAASGGLPAGTYHLKFTYIKDGEESGATQMSSITLNTDGAIALSSLPSYLYADYLRIYCTESNGKVFYKQVDLAVGLTSFSITKVAIGTLLETDNMQSNPTGHILAKYRGRIYWANHNRLYWTEPLRYGLYSPANYMLFPERITIVVDVEDGLYVVSDQTYYLDGVDPGSFKRSVSYPYGAVEGTQHKLHANVFNIDDYFGHVSAWLSTKGVVYAQNNGTIKPATEKSLALPVVNQGASTFYEQDGIRKLLITLQNQGGSNNFRASDKVTATVVRANEVT